MNLLLNVNENLYSIKGVVDGEKKLQAAIDEAMYEIKLQIQQNIERQKQGKKPQPYVSSIKDEYGKEIVSIKETRSLLEIRNNYNKFQQKLPFEKREENLLAAMDEIGNSDKSDTMFKEELAAQLNKAIFVMDANLSPGLERILDYFGDTQGIFSTINFKEDIAFKCIKDLIDLPNPNTGKPPKTFEQLLANIVSVNEVFKENKARAKYIDMARSYINVSYKNLIPQKYRNIFAERGGLENFLNNYAKQNKELEKINSKQFEVSEKNFKRFYQVFCSLEPFKNKPITLLNYLMNHVPKDKKEETINWLSKQGCKDEITTVKVLTKWADETLNKKQPKDNNIGRGE
ncbi:MAG: hypothetical protein E7059_07355 [Treponema bryantii]|nr:hypothetical protein [Treponema bryantii]